MRLNQTTRLFNVGEKVRIDDEPGTIEAVILGYADGMPRYDVRYGRTTILIAQDVPEDEIEPWLEDEE